jgi:predicted restriction endonuclease
MRIEKKDGGFYSEVAHIKAISTRVIGVDSIQNMLVLCPNHHKSLDHGKVTFESGFKLKINNESITLHVNEEHPLVWPE